MTPRHSHHYANSVAAQETLFGEDGEEREVDIGDDVDAEEKRGDRPTSQ
jgi:hypothetical protein